MQSNQQVQITIGSLTMLKFLFSGSYRKRLLLTVKNFPISIITPCHCCHVSNIFLAHSRESYINICVCIIIYCNRNNEPFCTVCSTRYRTQHFFNNLTTNEDIATKFEADYRHVCSSFLTQRTYSCSSFVVISSLVLELLKKCRAL